MLSLVRHGEPEVRSYAVSHAAGIVVPPQTPGWDQLVYASRGVLSVQTADRTWVVPPHRAVWVPAAVPHRLEILGRTSLRTLYFSAELGLVEAVCRVIDVPPLLRELVLYAVRQAPLDLDRPEWARLVGVIADQVTTLPHAGLQLPRPVDERAVALTDLMRGDLASASTIDALARRAGTGRRTLERTFRVETGMSIAQWRRRLRVIEAVHLLAAGMSATSTAARVGYSTPSAFSAAFRAELDTTPTAYHAVGGAR
jgi:AraC-like DNA-binding protein